MLVRVMLIMDKHARLVNSTSELTCMVPLLILVHDSSDAIKNGINTTITSYSYMH